MIQMSIVQISLEEENLLLNSSNGLSFHKNRMEISKEKKKRNKLLNRNSKKVILKSMAEIHILSKNHRFRKRFFIPLLRFLHLKNLIKKEQI